MGIRLTHIILWLPMMLGGCYPATTQPAARQGVLDLTQWDFQRSGSVNLEGDWGLYWKRFAEGVPPDEQLTGYYPLPGAWNTYDLSDTEGREGLGYGTYVLSVKLPTAVKQRDVALAIEALDVTSAGRHRVYDTTGNLLMEHWTGRPGTSQDNEVPFAHPMFSAFNTTEDIIVEIQFSNYHHSQGNVRLPRLGLHADLGLETNARRHLDYFAIGVICIVGLFHLALFAVWPQQTAPLWFAIFCALAACKTLITGHHVYESFPDRSDLYPLIRKIEYLCFSLGGCVFLGFVRSLYQRFVWPPLYYAIWGIMGAMSILILLTPMSVYTYALRPAQLITLVIFVWCVAICARARRADPNSTAFILLAGLLVVLGTGIHDGLVLRRIIEGSYVFQFGVIFLIWCQSLLLATLRQRLEMNLDQKSEHLENELAERQRVQSELSTSQQRLDDIKDELDHAQNLLVQAQKMSSLGELVSTIGHELNNPLQSIDMGRGQIERELSKLKEFLMNLVGDDPDAQKVANIFISHFATLEEQLGDQKVSTVVMREIATALRKTSRKDSSPVAGVQINELVHEALVIVHGKTKLFELETNLEDTPDISCYRSQITQLIINLVSNAADALKEKTESLPVDTFMGRINVRIRRDQYEGRDGLNIIVEDNGAGIPGPLQQKIFEPFFTTKSAEAGTGLGLAICTRIIQVHGGQSRVEDSQLGGARFIVWLPTSPEDRRTIAPQHDLVT